MLYLLVYSPYFRLPLSSPKSIPFPSPQIFIYCWLLFSSKPFNLAYPFLNNSPSLLSLSSSSFASQASLPYALPFFRKDVGWPTPGVLTPFLHPPSWGVIKPDAVAAASLKQNENWGLSTQLSHIPLTSDTCFN